MLEAGMEKDLPNITLFMRRFPEYELCSVVRLSVESFFVLC